MLGKEVDDELAAGLDQGSLFDMDLVTILRVPTSSSPASDQVSPTTGVRRIRLPPATKRRRLARSIAP